MKNNLERLIKQNKPFVSEYIKAEVGFIYFSSLLNHQHFQHFKQFGISVQQYNVLRILRGQYPNTVNLNCIKERMLDQMSDVSRIVSRLEKNKFIIKQTNLLDKRNSDITISESGLDLLNEIEKDNTEFNNLVSKLSLEDVTQLNEYIDSMLEGLK